MESNLILIYFCSISSPWAWVCRDSRCLKEERSLLADNETAYSVAGCKLMCGESSVLWPKPRGSVYLSRKLASFARDQLKFVKMSAPSKEVKRRKFTFNIQVLQFWRHFKELQFKFYFT
jgi:hypothetical protein